MSHNKMYRCFEGYEDALYSSCDVIDEVEELTHNIRYGEPYLEILEHINKIKVMLDNVKTFIEEGKGKEIK